MRVARFGRRTLVVAVALSVLLVAATPLAAQAEEPGRRRHMLELTNRDRVARDRHQLGFAARLSRYAKQHSQAMAARGSLFHSSQRQLLNALAGYRWRIGGENVGVGTSLEDLEDAFMASRMHRANILRHEYERAAVGIARTARRVWVTVIFYG